VHDTGPVTELTMRRQRVFGMWVTGHPALWCAVWLMATVAAVKNGFDWFGDLARFQRPGDLAMARWALFYAIVSWLLAPPALMASLGAGRRAVGIFRRRHWRGIAGYCRRCGYDLRATPERCPECGTFVGQPGSSKGPETKIGSAAKN